MHRDSPCLQVPPLCLGFRAIPKRDRERVRLKMQCRTTFSRSQVFIPGNTHVFICADLTQENRSPISTMGPAVEWDVIVFG